ncbi:hypothetical protein ACHAW5_011087 [Stephanodiscus triporus]|uniref:Uncharacterized protein n=1 Tax=Stephanodiscus triporus TaxID=2934178 RepID=A0ABD3QLT3_9STRA
MTDDDSSSGEDKISVAALGNASDAADATADRLLKSTVASKEKDESRGNNGFALTLIPTLLFKLTIVLLVKFATDIVVFPLLFLYRMARLGKRKVLMGFRKLFGGGDGYTNVEVNGDSSSADESIRDAGK